MVNLKLNKIRVFSIFFQKLIFSKKVAMELVHCGSEVIELNKCLNGGGFFFEMKQGRPVLLLKAKIDSRSSR